MKIATDLVASAQFPMSTPEIYGDFQFRVDLKGGRHLPVCFTVPDTPDTPPPDEDIFPKPSLITADKRADSVAADPSGAHTDAAVAMEVDRTNLLSVSASPT